MTNKTDNYDDFTFEHSSYEEAVNEFKEIYNSREVIADAGYIVPDENAIAGPTNPKIVNNGGNNWKRWIGVHLSRTDTTTVKSHITRREIAPGQRVEVDISRLDVKAHGIEWWYEEKVGGKWKWRKKAKRMAKPGYYFSKAYIGWTRNLDGKATPDLLVEDFVEGS